MGQFTLGKVLDGNGDSMLYKPKTLTDSRESACASQSVHVSDEGEKGRPAWNIAQIKVRLIAKHPGCSVLGKAHSYRRAVSAGRPKDFQRVAMLTVSPT